VDRGRGPASTVVTAVVALLCATLGARDRPLPDRRQFLEATRANLEKSQARQNLYAYREKRRELHANPFGRIGSGTGVEEYEVTPQPDGSISRTLVSRDGQPVTEGKTTRRRPRASTSKESPMTDVAETLELALDHRERRNNRDVLVVTFVPKADADPKTREGKLARLFRGRIFVDEAEAEVIRVEATAVDDISYGLGVVARLSRGATVTLVRERVDADTWLPSSIRFRGEGRAMLFRKLHVDHFIEWSDYRQVIPDRKN
jgi:hypothetical protein